MQPPARHTRWDKFTQDYSQIICKLIILVFKHDFFEFHFPALTAFSDIQTLGNEIGLCGEISNTYFIQFSNEYLSRISLAIGLYGARINSDRPSYLSLVII